MSKKYYELIADIIKDTEGGHPFDEEFNQAVNNTRYAIADRLAEAFKRDNPRFDRGRFMQACGLS